MLVPNITMNMQPIEILMVEDSPADVELAKEAFEEGKILNNFHYVTDGEKALDYLYRRNAYVNAVRPDIIILDINLPKVNGLDVLKEIKTNVDLKEIPVVMLTTSGNQDDINSSYKNYANSYIRKPIGLEKFIQALAVFEEFWFQIVKLPTRK